MDPVTETLCISLGLGLGLWAAAIAGTKQRSMLFFGSLGALFGCIGVLIAFLVKPARPPLPPLRGGSPELRTASTDRALRAVT